MGLLNPKSMFLNAIPNVGTSPQLYSHVTTEPIYCHVLLSQSRPQDMSTSLHAGPLYSLLADHSDILPRPFSDSTLFEPYLLVAFSHKSMSSFAFAGSVSKCSKATSGWKTTYLRSPNLVCEHLRSRFAIAKLSSHRRYARFILVLI